MASTNVSTFDAVLKEDYGKLVEQLSNTVVLAAQIEKKSDTADGRRAVHALHVSRNTGIGGAATGADLPVAGTEGYVDAYITLKQRYGAIQLERILFKLTDTNAGAFATAVDQAMKGVKNTLKIDEGRQAYGTSDGVVAATAASGPSTTVTLATTTTATQVRHLADMVGRGVDIGTVAAPTGVASNRTIQSVDETAKTLVISGAAVTTAATDRVFFTGQGGASSGTNLMNDGQKELTGLQTIVAASGTLHGVSATTYPVWKSFVSSNSGTNRQVTENLINNALFNVETRSDGEVDLLISNYGVYGAIAADMRAMRRNQDTVALKGGFSGIAYSIPGQGTNGGASTRSLVWDKDCPNNKLFGLTTSDLLNYEAAPWQWIDETGSIWNQARSATGVLDQYEARMARYHDFAATRRNSHFLISDLSELV